MSSSPDPAATLRALVTKWRQWAQTARRGSLDVNVPAQVADACADELEAALAAPALETPEKRIRYCTCLGNCRGKEGLGEGYICAFDTGEV